jgi:hypothetical protein
MTALLRPAEFECCTFWSAAIHRRFGIFRLGATYSRSEVSTSVELHSFNRVPSGPRRQGETRGDAHAVKRDDAKKLLLKCLSCGDAEKVLRTGEQSGDKSPQSTTKLRNSI